MIVLDWGRTPTAAPEVVLLFGSGLIGGAIASVVQRVGVGVVARRFDWSWPRPDPAQVRAVEAAAMEALAAREGAGVTVIWAAGRSGFGSGPDDMAGEFVALEHVLQTARRVGAALPPDQRAFVHVSSAGGLFEGQVACGLDTEPVPLRPYGHGKLAQEDRVRADEDLGRRLILRPSSVYGYTPGARRGLVAAFVTAAVQQRHATIFGSLTTLRDYVYAPDVGHFVAMRLLRPASDRSGVSTETCFLASARPASIFEIVRLVEGCLGKTLTLRIDPRPDNARNTSFLPSVLPEGFRPTRLQEGVALTAGTIIREHLMGVAS
jgi:nucleoside-diphosphate-sugar epimerase